MIYPENGKWRYRSPRGSIYDAEESVTYQNPNCYAFMEMDKKERYCNDTKQECEHIGGNVTVINSIDEYKQFRDNMLHVLSIWEESTALVYIQLNLAQGINAGWAIIYAYDGMSSNVVEVENIGCLSARMVNTIICESIGQTQVPTVNYTTLQPSYLSTRSLSAGKQRHTNTMSVTNIVERKTSSGLVIVVCVSSAAVIVTVIIIGFFGIGYFIHKINTPKKRYSNQSKGLLVSFCNVL
ncbi:uncharacterized protein [Antedon mediterranea]|uniref:uncharacterized protein n=1 Tax=Antedon mediterranea TaxID=105859 RepID=UPI003AF9B5E2